MADDEDKDKRRSRSEMHRRQRAKNLALMAVLAGLAFLFYLVAIVRIGGGLAMRDGLKIRNRRLFISLLAIVVGTGGLDYAPVPHYAPFRLVERSVGEEGGRPVKS